MCFVKIFGPPKIPCFYFFQNRDSQIYNTLELRSFGFNVKFKKFRKNLKKIIASAVYYSCSPIKVIHYLKKNKIILSITSKNNS